jgi:hypothetical protein
MLSLREYLKGIKSKEKSFHKPELESKDQALILSIQINILEEMLFELADELEKRLKALEKNITKKPRAYKTVLPKGKTAWDKKQRL